MTQSTTNWTAVWGNAMSITLRRPENYAKNLTLRYPFQAMLSGGQVRLTLDNFGGLEPVTISQVTIAPCDEKGNLLAPAQDVFFPAKDFSATAASTDSTTMPERSTDSMTMPERSMDSTRGSSQVTLAPGADCRSLPLAFALERGSYYAVSIYLADYTEMRSGVIITGPKSGGKFAIGNQVYSPELPLKESSKTNCYYFLSTIEVLPSHPAHTIVCYGDSITAQDWPDYLMEHFLSSNDTHTAVIRRASSGTRILREYDNIVYDSYGRKGEVRFPHEAAVSGADILIIQHGINDIIHPVGSEVNVFRPWSDMPTLEDLIGGMEKYIQWGREMGYRRIYLGTLLPIHGWRTDAPFREELRNQFNDWLRTTPLADGCIDFDAATRDEAHPAAFAPGFDSGDHLHPSALAYAAMGQAAYEYLTS